MRFRTRHKEDFVGARLRWSDTFRAAPTAENPAAVLVELADVSGRWAKVEIGTGNVEDFLLILRAARAEGRHRLREMGD